MRRPLDQTIQKSRIETLSSSDVDILRSEIGRLTIQKTFQMAKHEREKAELLMELGRLAETLINMSNTLNEHVKSCNPTGSGTSVDPGPASLFTQFINHHQR